MPLHIASMNSTCDKAEGAVNSACDKAEGAVNSALAR